MACACAADRCSVCKLWNYRHNNKDMERAPLPSSLSAHPAAPADAVLLSKRPQASTSSSGHARRPTRSRCPRATAHRTRRAQSPEHHYPSIPDIAHCQHFTPPWSSNAGAGSQCCGLSARRLRLVRCGCVCSGEAKRSGRASEEGGGRGGG